MPKIIFQPLMIANPSKRLTVSMQSPSARRPEKSLPQGVPADLQSAVKKKVRPMKTGGFVIPHNSPSITKDYLTTITSSNPLPPA